MVTFNNPKYGAIHPNAIVHAGGWRSEIGTLTRFGWSIEFSNDQKRDAVVIYFRNPTRNMVGQCWLESHLVQQVYTSEIPLLYMDEQILIETNFHRQIEIPKVELFALDVGCPTRPTGMLRGEPGEWSLYTADKQETEIIVTPEKVPMLLEEIRKAQAPRAKEIIHSQHRRDYKELETKATILAFGG